MNQLLEDLQMQMLEYYREIVILLPKLLIAIIVLLISLFLAHRVSRFSRQQLNARMEDPLLAQFFARAIRWTVYIIGFLVILRIVGLGEAAASLLAGAGITAFIIGFAFKDIGENFLAGILMAFKRPFRIGDTVETSGITGVIKGLNLRDTQLKTLDGKDVYIPNGQILKNPIFNYTIDGFLRHEFVIGLDYGTDVDQAVRIIYETLQGIKGLLWEEKAPNIVISDLTPSTLNLTIYIWVDTFDRTVSPLAVRTNAIREVLLALSKAGIYLPGDIMELKNYHEQPLLAVNRSATGDTSR